MSTSPPQKLKRPVRSHKKSRMGCQQCKKRRVKCDEVQPSCGNCSRRSTDCVYEPFCPPRKVRQASASTNGTRDSGPSIPLYPSTSKVESGLEVPLALHIQQDQQGVVEQKVAIRQQPTPAPFSTLDMVALKLLHHYNMQTCPTLAYSRQCLSSLQHAVPQVAFSSPCVMHAILGVSALHMHRLYTDPSNSDHDYLRTALEYKSQSCRALAQTTDPDAHFVAIAFLGIFGFMHSDTSPDLFRILSGVHTATKMARTVPKEALVPLALPYGIQIPRDPYGNIAITADDNFTPGYNEDGLPFLDILHHIHLPTPNYPDPAEVEDPETSEVYRQAVQGLLDCWILFQKPGSELTAALMWPTRFPPRFHQFLIVEKRQRALVLLYYYCFMLRWLQLRNCWWAQSFGDSMMQIEPMLDSRWMAWISAPGSYSIRG